MTLNLLNVLYFIILLTLRLNGDLLSEKIIFLGSNGEHYYDFSEYLESECSLENRHLHRKRQFVSKRILS